MTSRRPRAIVVGTSCSGKTTVARRISDASGIPHIELDALFWGSNWTPSPRDEFLERVRRAVEGDEWVLDGNYSYTRAVTWPRATHLMWLNLPFRVVLWRSVKRTFGRLITQEEMWAGNTESFRVAFSRNSIIWWVITTYKRRKRRYRKIIDENRYPHLKIYETKKASEIDAAISELTELRSGL
ncbi:MAG: adenylate kinase [Anaerolineales bacterium]